MGQKSAAYDSAGAITGFYDSIDSPVPAGVTALAITDAEWQTCLADPGYTVAGGALVAPAAPTPAQLLAEAQTSQMAVLQSAYQSAAAQPVAYMSTTFDADSSAAQNVQASLAALTPVGSTPAGFYWVDAANNHVPMTLGQVQGLAQAIYAQALSAFQKLQTLKALVRSATTVSAVQAVTW
jgi:hypothetical protein